MKITPSDTPSQKPATPVSQPGFDILIAVSDARQRAAPTTRMLRERAARLRRHDMLSARCKLLINAGQNGASRPASFLPLAIGDAAAKESVNRAFTRGFQPILNSLGLEEFPSAPPTPPYV